MDFKTCKRCGHLWAPRTEERPKCCPKCKSYEWDKKLLLPAKVREEKRDTATKHCGGSAHN
jgi:predicted  nucleic acid-binding Zn-ribbon protein